MIKCEPQAIGLADGLIGNLDVAFSCSGCLHCFPAGNMDLGSPQARVAVFRANEAIQIVGFDDVIIHYSQVAEPGCSETHKDIESDATCPDYEDSAPDEIGLFPVSPRAYGLGLTDAGLLRWLYCIIPRYLKLITDDPNVRGVGAVDCPANSNVPVTSGPRAVLCSKGHADQRKPCDFTDKVGVASLAITVRSAHCLPMAGPGVAVKEDQAAVIFLRCFGAP